MENKGISRNTEYRIQFLLFMCALPGTWSYQDISTKNLEQFSPVVWAVLDLPDLLEALCLTVLQYYI